MSKNQAESLTMLERVYFGKRKLESSVFLDRFNFKKYRELYSLKLAGVM